MTVGIATLTMNPSVDISANVDRVIPERKLRCRELRYDPGGGGINVARVLRRLGSRPVAAFTAGGANGTRLRRLVAAEKVSSLTIPIAGETRENLTAFDIASGDQYRFILPGPRLKAAEWRAAFSKIKALDSFPRVIVASGGLPLGVPTDFYGYLARRVRASHGRLALDTSGEPLKAGLAGRVWLVKPNLHEMEDLCGTPLPDEGRRLQVCRQIIGSGTAEVVALSLGHEGALLVSARGAWAAAPLPITPVSIVGAGDSFMAGLVWALVAGHPEPEALRWAVGAASATLLAPGTSLCQHAEIRRLCPLVDIRSLA